MFKKNKIFLVASSGGHFEQILMLKPLGEEFSLTFVTEHVPYDLNIQNTLFVSQLNRKDNFFVFKFVKAIFQAANYILRENPKAIVSTGALSSMPFLLVGKLLGKKIVFIESFAKSDSPTLTGKIVYHFADMFIVQWPEMKNIYPKALYLGSIY
ncbi:PssD/Cps14F family polysaccharide biosynthesis glycosyltransferase [Leuconostoc mesenteroides]|uniref:PssD/Cps14F family polysaccharide biosynthesis glycosyltransferase n=2 Tax=Leuconostoc mesenteroides TaxID=1245 RepID=UPI000750C1F0|nr:PssD/Cps14F family polysaccharide biosynthesis glycosyltransferase [Leuconostoc mesenteroides]MBZ1519310.1 polysaccharide biosynthesis protein [Leuconostoc mesenteroides]MBZ1521623.1 polysaccharide biosynthesis protein [Leuconostoc mesenteroides]WMS39192.1 PssD/Cps14F family polysaccharide biosynthesis glycosyltransferase [Leuconostoc mesenteroides]